MTSAKHLVVDPHTLVKDSLLGFTLANPHVFLDEKDKVIYIKDLAARRKDQVTLFCGGGSGHEPAHAGFVGHGILTASVSGHVFASPTSSQVLSCLRRIYSEEKGSLVIIKNYTGDILNFGRAVERFKSERVNSGRLLPNVAMVVVNDDVGVVNSSDDEQGGVGRRGLAGTVLTYKIAGACAANGGTLEQVKETALYVISHTFTIGCALNAASVPGLGMPRVLETNEMEIGMGIHNEPGFEKKALEPADVLVQGLIDHILASQPFRSCNGDKTHVVILVNNLGAISNLEMGLVTKLAVESAIARGLKPIRVFSGTYMTGLAMPGTSISLLVLPDDEMERKNLISLIDQPAECPGWINHAGVVDAGNTDESARGPEALFTPSSDSTWERIIETAYNSVVNGEPEVTRLDQLMGDGDCGQVLLSGATAIYRASKDKALPLRDPPAALARISSLVEDAMGGTSGIIYCLFLDGLSQHLHKLDATNASLSPKMWGHALVGALETLYQYTSARPGHRTLIDCLEPFASTLAESGDLNAALIAADTGAKATATMRPKRGRAVYVSQKDGLVDAGAAGLMSVLTELPFAGHPTLGTCRAFLEYSGAADAKGPRTIVQECGVGLMELLLSPDGSIAFVAPPLLESGAVEEDKVQIACQAMGLDRKEILDTQWINNGVKWLALLVKDVKTVLRAKRTPTELFKNIKWGILGKYPEDKMKSPKDPLFEVRTFPRSGMVDEDPVTGSFNAGMAQWLIGNDKAPAKYVASQGTAMGRHGRVLVSRDESDLSMDEHKRKVWVGGHSVICIKEAVRI
ncbi:Dihydroxyacetone kinase 2 [Mortierella sp. GBA30]|nr:Dihydroxyacetone kinase 2 [Mortierella sp. GBA30]